MPRDYYLTDASISIKIGHQQTFSFNAVGLFWTSHQLFIKRQFLRNSDLTQQNQVEEIKVLTCESRQIWVGGTMNRKNRVFCDLT